MAWLNYVKRIKLTIDNTNVDGTLSNFPVLVKLSDSSGISSSDVTSVFTELGSNSNRKKIAITTSDSETQCYVEIERFDYSNSVAELWVKVPTVVSGTTTDLYLYYDSTQSDNTTYIGDTGDTPAQNVWDSNFKLVMHMAQNPNGDVVDAIKDSTSNANHGTPGGSMTTADLVDGKIGKALDFDGGDDYVSLTNTLVLSDDKTITIVFKPQSTDTQVLLSVSSLDSYGEGSLNGNTLSWRDSNAKGKEYFNPTPSEPFDVDVWKYVAFTVLDGGVSAKLYNDGSLSVENISGNIYGPENVKRIAYAVTTANRHFFTGQVCNVCVSNTVRSDAWIKATYYNNWDELVSFGHEETEAINYIAGYVKEHITPITRQIYLHNRDTGALIGSTTSSGAGGYFYCETTYSGSHYVVCLDDEAGVSYNDLIYGNIYPATTSG